MMKAIAPWLAAALFLSGVALGATIETIPVDEIQPGMVGEGRTVFSGQKIDSFKVTIMGVLRNYGPDQNMILAELEGGPLAHTGVIAGMSGSPVYVDGKLIGAVAYAFPFAKDPICGITPIAEMMDATRAAAQAPRSARARGAAKLEFPLTPDGLARVAPHPSPVAIQGIGLTGVSRLEPHLGRELVPIATPASVLGFSRESFDAVAPLLRQLGLEPLMGGAAPMPASTMGSSSASLGASSSSQGSSASNGALEPGDSVGVGLVTGDLAISASGTVTHVDPDSGEVYAFGHPLFNLGPIEYPMMDSEVHLVLPSVMNSFKMASSGATIGTWVQDRSTAIRGILGTRPRMIPLKVSVTTSRGYEKDYSLEVVDDELFTPVLAYSSLMAILQATERQFGNQTVKLSAWISLDGNRRINVEDVFSEQASLAASAMVAAPMQFLMTNDFEEVTVREVNVTIEAFETPQTAQLERAWFDTDEVVSGGKVGLNILLRTYRGDSELQTFELEIPQHIRAGKIRVMVADAGTVSAVERREARSGFVPTDMKQLVRAINALRKNNRLYVRLSRSDGGGAIVAGEYMSSLPPSVLNVLEADVSGNDFQPLGSSVFMEQEIVTDYSVSGSRVLELEVKKR